MASCSANPKPGVNDLVMTGDKFLSELTSLSQTNKVDAAMLLVVRWFEQEFCAGDFDVVGEVLKKVDLSTLNVNLVVGLLAASYQATRQLGAYRVDFAARARPVLEEGIGCDRVTNIIYSRLG